MVTTFPDRNRIVVAGAAGSGDARVIEAGHRPVSSDMAVRATLPTRNVVRCLLADPDRCAAQVTGFALGRGPFESTPCVAFLAANAGVGASEWKAGLEVIEFFFVPSANASNQDNEGNQCKHCDSVRD